MRNRIKSVLVSVLLALIILAFLSVFMKPSYIMLRLNPDLTVNTGFAEPYFLSKERWTSLEQTSYKSGEVTSSAVFSRTLFSNYAVVNESTTKNGEVLSLSGKATGDYSRYDYVEGYNKNKETVDEHDSEFLYVKGSITLNENGNIDSYYVVSGNAYGNAGEMLNFVRVEYDESGKIIRQNHYTQDNTALGYINFEYDDQNRLIHTEEFTEANELVRFTDIEYNGDSRKSTTYSSDGSIEYYTDVEVDVFGQLLSRTITDSDGDLVSEELYNYKFWEVYRSTFGIIVLICTVLFSSTIGFGMYEAQDKKKIGNQEDHPE